MILARARLAELSLLILLACIQICSASSDIPKSELKALVQSAQAGPIWQIDQIATGSDGMNWAVGVLSHPRTIPNDYCVARLTNLGIESRDGKYVVVEVDTPRPVVAWENCGRARFVTGDFHDVYGNMTDEELVKTMRTIEIFLGSGGTSKSLSVHFDSDDLRACIRTENLKYLQSLERRNDGSVSFSLGIPQLYPTELDMQLIHRTSGASEIYVSKGLGPDLVQN